MPGSEEKNKSRPCALVIVISIRCQAGCGVGRHLECGTWPVYILKNNARMLVQTRENIAVFRYRGGKVGHFAVIHEDENH